MDRFRSFGFAALAAVAFIALPSIARADHFRGGYITWKLLPSPAFTVEFQSVQVWRSDAVTPLEINPGVGSDVTIIGPVSTIYTAVDLVGDSYTVIQYKVRYTYPGPAAFTAFLGVGTHDVTCCRIIDLVNVSDQPQRIATVVDLGNSNMGSPVPAIPMLLQLKEGCPNSVQLPIAADPDGISCSLAIDGPTGAGTASGIVPAGLTVSPGCLLSWTPPTASVGKKYAVQILINEGSISGNTGQVAVDLIIELTAGQCCGNGVREGNEICDGTDDAACPGGCQANCSCCGDGVTEPAVGEICDGTDDTACPGGCQANCSCCGDGIIEPAVGEVCDGANDAACFPSPGFGCGLNCQCALQSQPSGCVDSCANDVSVCSGISGQQTVDVGVPFSTVFLGTDPCDMLFVNDPPWGLLPPGAQLFGGTPGGPAPGSMQAPPTTGTCSNNPNLTCTTCEDCNGCTHNLSVGCTTDSDCSSLSLGSTCIQGGTCNKPSNQFTVTFDWIPQPSDAAQTYGTTITFTPPGFTVPGGTQYYCNVQFHVRGCGDDIVDPGEQCDGTQNAACMGAPCLPPDDPSPARRCQCATCGDGEVNQPSEQCDGAAPNTCGGAACLPNCKCARCGDDDVNQPSEQCDGTDDGACPGHCLPTCKCAVCGDGIIQPGIGERCEPTNDAACPGQCVAPPDPNQCHCRGCGDNIVNQPSEQCDGTADAACPGLCLSSCLCARCGDGAVNQPSEQCDGAADAACPGLCQSNCLCARCGDGAVDQPSEQCDGAADAACPGLCQSNCLCARCGDGSINRPGEQCDGADAAACVGQCRPPGDPNQCRCPVCGDGDVNQPSEQCDGADDAACPGKCLATCLCPVCGDGIVSPPEQCEAGSDAACPGRCRPPGDQNACRCPVCGDNDVNQASEQCDGTDDAACPGACAASCRCAVCGDGIVAPPVEDCESTNDSACPGKCAPPGDPNACRCPRCGDGVVNQPSEECDGAATGSCVGGVCQPDCTYATCGNCTLDAGEQCDPPNREICNNLIDDDGDGKINCDDTDCTPGRTCKHPKNSVINALVSTLVCASSADCNNVCSHDLVTPCLTNATCNALVAGSFCIDGAKCICPDAAPAGFQTCGATCAPVFGCGCIRNDPARIRFGKSAGAPDLLLIHGRFLVSDAMDPPSDGFTLLLVNTHGIVYQGTLRPGDLVGRPGRYGFSDRSAKTGAGTRDGLYRVSVRIKMVKGALNYVFKAQVYGDLSHASALMTTQVIAGNATASLSGEWTASTSGWKLTDFE